MKSIFVILSSLCFSLSIWSQTCDIATAGVMANPNSISVGQTCNLVFGVINDAGEPQPPDPPTPNPCSYAANSVEVILSLPSNGLAFQSIISPAGGVGPFFTWTYNPGNKTVRGINHTALFDTQGEVVTVRVVGTALASYPAIRSVVINLLQYFDGPIFPSNNEGNDNGTTAIQITAPLPIELMSFNAKNQKCNLMELAWETASEKNNAYFDVERSVDGRDFLSVGKVTGTNEPGGSLYTFVDDNNLKYAPFYYYRLKQVDFDGRFEHFDIIKVENSCENEGVSMSVYPNPAFDKVNVSLNGLSENDRVKLIITNVIGEVVMSIPDASASEVNEIKLNGLTAGIYNVKLVGFEETTSKRFIKVD